MVKLFKLAEISQATGSNSNENFGDRTKTVILTLLMPNYWNKISNIAVNN